MENVIYNELRMRGYNVDVGVVPIAQRDQDGKPMSQAPEHFHHMICSTSKDPR